MFSAKATPTPTEKGSRKHKQAFGEDTSAANNPLLQTGKYVFTNNALNSTRKKRNPPLNRPIFLIFPKDLNSNLTSPNEKQNCKDCNLATNLLLEKEKFYHILV